MVLVDTSVWIRFLANRPPYGSGLGRLLAEDLVSAHDLVHGELLMRDKGGRTHLLSDYERLFKAPVVPHVEVVHFVRRIGLNGQGIGWVDAHLLAAALVGSMRLWTADARLASVASSLGVGYEPDGTGRALGRSS